MENNINMMRKLTNILSVRSTVRLIYIYIYLVNKSLNKIIDWNLIIWH